MGILNKIGKKIINGINNELDKTQPYKCKICWKYTAYKSDFKGICRKCASKIKKSDEQPSNYDDH